MYIESEGNVIKMYGTIWEGDGAYLAKSLSKAIGTNKEVFVHLHTPGGSVIDANLVYNELKGSKSKINIVIDGLAASMGSILMLAGDTVSIAENAYVMIHAPSGNARGTSKEFASVSKLLANLEKNFIKKYTAKSNLTEEVVQGWLIGDNWFSAEEALEAGLVDSIIDPVIKESDLSMFSPDLKLTAIAEAFAPFEKPVAKEEIPQSIPNNKNNDNMKLNAQSLTVLGLAQDAPENEVNQAIEALHKKNESLASEIQENNNAKIKALVDGAVKSGRIKEEARKSFTALAEKDFDSTEKVINAMPEAKVLPSANLKNKSDAPEGREKWTLKMWKEKDMPGLIALKNSNPEAYEELRK